MLCKMPSPNVFKKYMHSIWVIFRHNILIENAKMKHLKGFAMYNWSI